MARVFASLSGSEVLPDLTLLRKGRGREQRGLLDREGGKGLGPRWDKCEGEGPEDHGDVGIDAQGILVRRHPDLILADMDPLLSTAIDRFRRGQHAVTESDESRTAYEFAVKMAMREAVARKEKRRDG